MLKKQNQENQIEITNLIGDAVNDAITRREKHLTPEEAEQIKGGTGLIDKIIHLGGYLIG
ncbi:MAG: hypothetical protein QNJ42_11565 [Crocosphaera sp.]|nr:hypothetical protein [Crocosphaera sp.]